MCYHSPSANLVHAALFVLYLRSALLCGCRRTILNLSRLTSPRLPLPLLLLGSLLSSVRTEIPRVKMERYKPSHVPHSIISRNIICSDRREHRYRWNDNSTNHQPSAPLVQNQVTLNRQHGSHASFCRGPSYAPSEELANQQDIDSFGAVSRSQIHRPGAGRPNRRWDGEGFRKARREIMLRGLTPSKTHPRRAPALRNLSTEKQGLAGGSGQGSGDPATVNPGTANPGTSNTKTNDPGTAGPTAANPATAHPVATNPATADPATANPATCDPAIGDPVCGDPASDSGKVSVSKDSLPANGDWSEELRIKDELISTLKRQLTALGEQPMEEVVTLEVRSNLSSSAL